ncbi:hypothetical protein MPSEU_000395600 [Mayamaea pseudoterrestris]|nr:hypothetical protein MPSEU_000395600 [Mayamaea pseudoterrestris]
MSRQPDNDDATTAARALTPSETNALQLQLEPIFKRIMSSDDDEDDDQTDLLSYTTTMVSNGKTISYILDELEGIMMDMDALDKEAIASIILKAIKGTNASVSVDAGTSAAANVESTTAAAAPDSNDVESTAPPAATQTVSSGNALTMSGALGASRERKPVSKTGQASKPKEQPAARKTSNNRISAAKGPTNNAGRGGRGGGRGRRHDMDSRSGRGGDRKEGRGVGRRDNANNRQSVDSANAREQDRGGRGRESGRDDGRGRGGGRGDFRMDDRSGGRGRNMLRDGGQRDDRQRNNQRAEDNGRGMPFMRGSGRGENRIDDQNLGRQGQASTSSTQRGPGGRGDDRLITGRNVSGDRRDDGGRFFDNRGPNHRQQAGFQDGRGRGRAGAGRSTFNSEGRGNNQDRRRGREEGQERSTLHGEGAEKDARHGFDSKRMRVENGGQYVQQPFEIDVTKAADHHDFTQAGTFPGGRGGRGFGRGNVAAVLKSYTWTKGGGTSKVEGAIESAMDDAVAVHPSPLVQANAQGRGRGRGRGHAGGRFGHVQEILASKTWVRKKETDASQVKADDSTLGG